MFGSRQSLKIELKNNKTCVQAGVSAANETEENVCRAAGGAGAGGCGEHATTGANWGYVPVLVLAQVIIIMIMKI